MYMYLSITYNGADSAQGILCSREPHCNYVFVKDSVRECCVQEGALSYIPTGVDGCLPCYGMLNIVYRNCRFVIFCAL